MLDPAAEGACARRAALIDAALARRNYAPELAPRIERLLDGVEDRARLRCCNSGCYVCAQELLAILGEVESGMKAGQTTPG
jgi:hypothetical protein